MSAFALWGTGAQARPGERKTMPGVIAAIARGLDGASPADRARLRHRLGYIAYLAGDVRTKAHESFTMMLEDATAARDKGLEALAHCGLAFVHDFIGERHQSLEHARTAGQIAGSIGDRRIGALALNAEAQFLKENGENERARELFTEVHAIGEALHDARLVMGGAIGLGRTTKMSDAPRAIAHYEAAIAIARSQGDNAALALCLNNLSDWKIYQGELRESIDLREQCLSIAERHGLKPIAGRAVIGMAKAWTLLGDLEKARQLLDRGFPKVLSVADLEGDLHASLNLAYLYVQSGDIPRAAQLYRDTLNRSLAAPDHACAVFAERALDLLAEGGMPRPGILPDSPAPGAAKPAAGAKKRTRNAQLRDLALRDEDLDAVRGGQAGGKYTYPTGDLTFAG